MTKFRETKKGITFQVKVIPKSSCSKIVGWEEDLLKVRLAAVPEKGEANKELVKLLSQSLKVAKTTISIIQGETSRVKTVLIRETLLEHIVRHI